MRLGILKDIVGVVVSATITGSLFLGAPIIGLIVALIPQDLVEVLTTRDRPVYFDGAYVLSPIEVDGELDGTEPEPNPDPDEPDAPVPDERDGSDSKGPTDPKSKVDSAGAEVVATAVSPVGTAAGGARGHGIAAQLAGRRHPKGTTQKRSRRKCPKTFDGMSKRADGTYLVSRKLVNYHTASVKRFNELGWSKANDKGDKKGWYVSGFGCRDALWHGGIRRGDVVMTVNGKKTNNMLQILFLYQKVKTKKRFEVVVKRKGKSITLKYEIIKNARSR